MDRITLSDGTVVETSSVKLPDGSVAKEFELPSGTARVRVLAVPPMLISDVVGRREDLQDPPVPRVKVGGVTEKWLAARPGQDEYVEWEKECARVKQKRDEAWSVAWWNYGLAEWRLDDGEWVEDVPKGWKLPERVKRLGVTPRTDQNGKRADFIQYVLLKTNPDVEVCQLSMAGQTSPILASEVDAIARLFQSQESGEGDSESAAK